MPSLPLSLALSLYLSHTHTHTHQPKSGQVGLSGFLFRVDVLSTILAFSHFNLAYNFSKLIVFLVIFYQLLKIIDWLYQTIKANRFPEILQRTEVIVVP